MSIATVFQPERVLTYRDLRLSWNVLVKELQLGHSFLVHHGDLPLARLLPVVIPTSAPTPPDPIGLPLLVQLSLTVGMSDLAAMAGLTEPSFVALSRQRQLPTSVLKRLETLNTLMGRLTTYLHATEIGRWFRLRRAELKGRSVLTHLTFPWEQGSASVQLVERLALNESLTRVSLPPPPGSAGRGR